MRDPDYMLYMDLHQMINLRLLEELHRLGTNLASPTRTVPGLQPAGAQRAA